MSAGTNPLVRIGKIVMVVVALMVMLWAAGKAVAADNGVQGAIPDFYQHQGDNEGVGGLNSNSPSANGIWNPDNGWCALVADMDALYPWENVSVLGSKPYDNNNQWLFGAPAAPGNNPGTGTALTGNGTWVPAADDTVIPALVKTPGGGSGTINNYLAAQKVGPANLGLAGLVDTQYQVLLNGTVQVATIAGWQNIPQNTFQLYQQLTSAGSNLPAGTLQQLAAITTTIRINYTPGNNGMNAPVPAQNTTDFWWNFHQVAGAGTAGANTIQYSDPDAIPINAGNRNGGFTQPDITANQYTNAPAGGQQAGAPPLPGNGAYTTNNLYSTMVVNALGQVTGGNGPYAAGLLGAAAPVTRITNMDAVSLPAVQLVNNIAQAGYNAVSFLFSGDFGGNISKMEIFTNSPLANTMNNSGLSDNDSDWSIAPVTQDPFGNTFPGDAGIELQEGAGGQDLLEGATDNGAAPDYTADLDTAGPVSDWTVYAYDDVENTWLVETYGATVGFGDPAQVPEPGTFALMSLGALALLRWRHGKHQTQA